jgi:tetratricopeptide (TPR) repeat protein
MSRRGRRLAWLSISGDEPYEAGFSKATQPSEEPQHQLSDAPPKLEATDQRAELEASSNTANPSQSFNQNPDQTLDRALDQSYDPGEIARGLGWDSPRGHNADEPWLASRLSELLRRKVAIAGFEVQLADPEANLWKGWSARLRERTSAPNLAEQLSFVAADALVMDFIRWHEGKLYGLIVLQRLDQAPLHYPLVVKEDRFLELVDGLVKALLSAILNGAELSAASEALGATNSTRNFKAFLAMARAERHWQAENLAGTEHAVAEARRLDFGYTMPLRFLAAVYRSCDRLDDEIRVIREETELHERADEHALSADAQARLGHAYSNAGRWNDALAAYARSQKLWQDLEIPRMVAQARSNSANVLLHMGQVPEAIREYEASLAKLDSSSLDHARLLYNLGLALGQASLFREGVARLDEALVSARSHQDNGLICRIHNALGAIYDELDEEHLADALRHYRMAEEYFGSDDDPSLLASIKDHMAITYRKLGDLSRALSYSSEACELLEELGNDAHCAIAWLNRASLLLAVGEREEAEALAEQALEVFKSCGSPHQGEAERFLGKLRERGLGLDET